jgi:hypothetical protein
MRTYIIAADLADAVKKHHSLDLMVDTELLLNTEFVDKLMKTKTSTVRYRKGLVRIPASHKMPLYESNTPGQKGNLLGTLTLSHITIKTFAELTDKDGRNDGFANALELQQCLEKIYGHIENSENVSIYHIEKFERAE